MKPNHNSHLHQYPEKKEEWAIFMDEDFEYDPLPAQMPLFNAFGFSWKDYPSRSLTI